MHTYGLIITDQLFYQRTLPFVFITITIVVVYSFIARTVKNNTRRAIFATTTLIYLIVIFYITIFSRTPSENHIFYFDFLASIKRTFSIVNGHVQYEKRDAVIELVLNIVLYVPLGFLICGISKNKSLCIIVAIINCILLSLIIEIIQYFTGFGTGELTDIFNNSIGAVLGILLYRLLVVGNIKEEHVNGHF